MFFQGGIAGMKRLTSALNSKWCAAGLALAVFLFMLLLNFLTPYVADDYVYRYGFHDHEHVESVLDVVKSMYVHSYAMNGRVVSHFFGELFMIWPKAPFNFANAGMFTLLWYVLWRVASVGAKRNILIGAGIFMALWYWMPVFGQVALWQLGSVNYLWGMGFGMLFISPYVYRLMHGGELIKKSWQRAVFCVLALPFGMYIEVMSFVGLFIAAALMALSLLFDKRSLKSWLLAPIGIGGVGYMLLMSMPAEMKAKKSSMALGTLIGNISSATQMLRDFGRTLLIIWAVLAVLALFMKVPGKRVALSAVLAVGAVGGNYMLIFAGYYPERCASAPVTLLILACALLLAGFDVCRAGEALRCSAVAALTVVFAFSLIEGTYSIWRSYAEYRDREDVIESALAAGERDLELPLVHPTTPYSAFWGLRDLATDTADTWPNTQFASYHGLDSVIGK